MTANHLLAQVFGGSPHYMAAWARKLLCCAQARPRLVSADEVVVARAALAHLQARGLA